MISSLVLLATAASAQAPEAVIVEWSSSELFVANTDPPPAPPSLLPGPEIRTIYRNHWPGLDRPDGVLWVSSIAPVRGELRLADSTPRIWLDGVALKSDLEGPADRPPIRPRVRLPGAPTG